MFSFRKQKGGRKAALTPDGRLIWITDPYAIPPTRKISTIEQAFGGNLDPELKHRIESKLEAKRVAAAGLFDEYKVPGEGHMTPLWREDADQRDVIYITGPSGAGKSTWVAMMIRVYKVQFPRNRVFVFSRVDEDPVIDNEGVIRVKLDESIFVEPFESKMFENSLTIFDDAQTLPKKIEAAVRALRDDLLETGRHGRTSMLITSHQSTDYVRTRLLLTEATGIVVFPKAGAFKPLEYLCSRYIGMTTQQIRNLRNLPSRWVYLNKSAPLFVEHEKGIYALK